MNIKGLRSLQLLPLLLLATAFAVFLNQDSSGAQVTGFNACASAGPVETTPNTVSNIKGVFGVGIGEDCVKGNPYPSGDDAVSYNTGALVGVTPAEWGVAASADVPIGTKIGTFSSVAQLGLLNNPCGLLVPVAFDLLNASIDTTDTISPKPPLDDGTSAPNRLEPLAADADDNGVPDGADKWPDYLTKQADKPEIPWDFSHLRARYVGFNTSAVPNSAIVLNFLVWEPGAPIHELFVADPRLGYLSQTVLNDPTTVAAAKDPISDFCAPLTTGFEIIGNPGGDAFRTNPGDGAYNFITLIANIPDADGDGIENTLDACALIPNTTWDPRNLAQPGPGDEDGDGLPNDEGCDPDPANKSNDNRCPAEDKVAGLCGDDPTIVAPAGSKGYCAAGTGIAFTDEDCDKWQNRGDNCPLVRNNDQKDSEPDGIGDACDPDVTTRNGPIAIECEISPVTIGTGGTQAIDPTTVQPCDPTAALPTTAATATPVGQTPGPTPVPCTGAGCPVGPVTGIGSLSPIGTSTAAWAALVTALGVIGVLGGAGLAGTRLWRKR